MNGNLLVLVVLLIGAGVAGAWNYQRNALKDEGSFRPYAAYSDADLQALTGAYQTEVDDLNQRYAAAKAKRYDSRGGGLLDEKVRRFEEAQEVSAETRELGARLSVREADLRELHHEQGVRAKRSDGLKVFVRRLLTF